MMHHPEYEDVPTEAIDDFVRSRELGRLVTVAADGVPAVGLYPFVYAPPFVELHTNRADEQLSHLTTGRRCVFEVDEPLGVIPSYWIDPEDAVMATAYHRTVAFECEPHVSTDAEAVAQQQVRLLARHQPEGGFRPVDPEEPLYRQAIGRIAAVRLRIVGRRVKWKLGQNRPVDVRAKVVRELRQRGRPLDGQAADALQWTIDREGAG